MKLKKSIACILAVITLLTAFCGTVSANEAAAFALSCTEDVAVGGEIAVTVTLSRVDIAISGIEFSLTYDSEYVLPKITSNENSQMDLFAKTLPSGWEQLCSYSEQENKYYLRFCVGSDSTNYITDEDDIVIRIPFTVREAGVFDFTVDSGDIIIIGAHSVSDIYGGAGATVSAVGLSESDKLALTLSGSETAYERGIYNLTAEVTNLGDSTGIIAFECDLHYDTDIFEPVITANEDGEMDAFMTDMPADGWEQMCSLDSDEGCYTLRFAALGAGTVANEILKSGESFLVTIPFKVIGAEGDVGAFAIKRDTVLGVNGVTGIVTGSGSTFSTSVADSPVASFPEKYTVADGLIYWVAEKTEIADFVAELGSVTVADKDGNAVTDDVVKTGQLLVAGDATYVIVVKGDANGNGKIDAPDYLMAKRAVLGTYTPSSAELRAMAISGGEGAVPDDYFMLKRHVLGTFDINGG